MIINKPFIHILPVGILGFTTPVEVILSDGEFTNNLMVLRTEMGASAIFKVFANEIATNLEIYDSVFGRNYLTRDTKDFLLYESSTGVFIENLSGSIYLLRN